MSHWWICHDTSDTEKTVLIYFSCKIWRKWNNELIFRQMFNLLYSFPVVYFVLYMKFNSLKMTCTYSSVVVPQLSLADVVRFSLPDVLWPGLILGSHPCLYTPEETTPPISSDLIGSHYFSELCWTTLLVKPWLFLLVFCFKDTYHVFFFVQPIPGLPDWVVRECIELKRVGSLEAHSPCML